MAEIVNTGHAQIPSDILDDISSRFIINIPADERNDVIRLMFQIELGHWFYIDFHCALRKDLPKLNLRTFCLIMFNHVPFLKKHLTNFDNVLDQWKSYKCNVPTFGAIILDDTLDYVLMVQGFWAKSSWGFPKGKVNHEEDPVACACREVREETGFDCSSLVDEREFIELKIRDTSVRLYIVYGVRKDTIFQPTTRNEIKSIEWFAVKDLPSHKNDKNANSFFMAIPFVKHLRRWISSYRQRAEQESKEYKLFLQREVKNKQNKKTTDGLINNGHNDVNKCNDKMTPRFWAKSWNNVTFDWNKIWSENYNIHEMLSTFSANDDER
ncbi:mRNA-decapping enzyme-like protein [Dinothrombium tinctorium]|uniref:m7GpppN-mRNA hydrolase n=1 Tax=Dinothrombium tinctorium TaxID=1965070 RepID=A0A3S3Q3I7_9ACAR|nr:mRNA-decapping enzyme-like protein [Dinothrombium tinctorium]